MRNTSKTAALPGTTGNCGGFAAVSSGKLTRNYTHTEKKVQCV